MEGNFPGAKKNAQLINRVYQKSLFLLPVQLKTADQRMVR
jgi:hypothetical protein